MLKDVRRILYKSPEPGLPTVFWTPGPLCADEVAKDSRRLTGKLGVEIGAWFEDELEQVRILQGV